jgi:hypothetical protein
VASAWGLARAVVLLVVGVLVFSDIGALAWAGFYATLLMLIVIGFIEHRLRAVAWAGLRVASALVADVLWQFDWEPFNRSDDYEAIPQTPFVFIGLPIPMAIIGLGVGAGALWRRS